MISCLPPALRSPLFRRQIHCDWSPPANLTLKLAESREELEACFRLLHGAYVRAGLMRPHPSGLRATLYHALPTTSTLLARIDDQIVGTVSLVRQSQLGFPLQKIFRIDAIERTGGNIAEVSALAIDPRYQAKGGTILFPLLKFMYEYATRLFDTQHLVIAVNPRHIGFYESVLFFRRLEKNIVPHYDFVNGAPAVGAHLDLKLAVSALKRAYDHLEPSRNLYRYFMQLRLPNIVFPEKRFFTTNDPVMTPALLDYFFNQRTQLFSSLPPAERKILHAIYDLPAYKPFLPPLQSSLALPQTSSDRRRHQRFSISCPGEALLDKSVETAPVELKVLECSSFWLRAEIRKTLTLNRTCLLTIQLGSHERSILRTRVVRKATTQRNVYVFEIEAADLAWQKFVGALNMASTHRDLEHATRFLEC